MSHVIIAADLIRYMENIYPSASPQILSNDDMKLKLPYFVEKFFI